jgi:tRNA 2-thiouridine synthesizing protein A
VDARGVMCPEPLMELMKALRQQEVGDVVVLYSDDLGSRKDIPQWVAKSGYELLAVNERDGYVEYSVRKAK